MTFETYDEFLRHTTMHLHLQRLRPVLGAPRWAVSSTAFTTMRPLVVWGSERRARQVGQRTHAAHAQARHAVVYDLPGDIAGTWRVRREYGLLWSDHPDACRNAQQVGGRWPETTDERTT